MRLRDMEREEVRDDLLRRSQDLHQLAFALRDVVTAYLAGNVEEAGGCLKEAREIRRRVVPWLSRL